MRIPFPSNVTWADRDRVQLPMAVIWHGNAVEVDDGMPAKDLAALRAALATFDPKIPTAAELALEAAKAKAREARAKGKDQKIEDLDARLMAIEMALGLLE